MAKQNKFTKSVQERIEQEAKRKPAPKPLPMLDLPPQPEEQTAPLTEEPTPPPQAVVLPEEPEAVPITPSSVQAQPTLQRERVDLSAYLQKKTQRRAKNKTFYLDKEVCDAIRQEAKTAGITESRLVNDILRAVLGVGTH